MPVVKLWALILLLLAVAALALLIGSRSEEPAPGRSLATEDTPGEHGPRLVGHPAEAVVVVRGRVTDENGDPVTDLGIRIDGRGSTPCGTDARFEVKGLAPGVHEFQALRGTETIGKPVSLEIQPGPGVYEVELVVPPVRTIVGHVIDHLSAAVAGAGIAFKNASGTGFPHSTTTSTDGSFRVSVPTAGTYMALVDGQRVEGTYEAGQQDAIVLLPDPSQLRIRIVDPSGALVPRAKLMVTTGAAMRSQSMTHEVVGGLHTEDVSQWGVDTDLYVTNPCDEDGRPLPLCSRRLENVDPTTRDLEIQLSAGRPLTGRTVDEEGSPFPRSASRCRIRTLRPVTKMSVSPCPMRRAASSSRQFLRVILS